MCLYTVPVPVHCTLCTVFSIVLFAGGPCKPCTLSVWDLVFKIKPEFFLTFQVVKERPQVRLGGRAWPACSVRSRCRHGTWAQGGTPPHTAASPGTPWLKQPAAKQ